MNSRLHGRMNRATYWLLLVVVVLFFAVVVTLGKRPPGIAEALVVLLGVPRLHDIDRSGWWITILFGLEIISIAIAFITLPVQDVLVIGGFVAIGLLIAMMILGCIPGQVGPNAYGEQPASGVSFGRASS